jgi:hypothetical protein
MPLTDATCNPLIFKIHAFTGSVSHHEFDGPITKFITGVTIFVSTARSTAGQV